MGAEFYCAGLREHDQRLQRLLRPITDSKAKLQRVGFRRDKSGHLDLELSSSFATTSHCPSRVQVTSIHFPCAFHMSHHVTICCTSCCTPCCTSCCTSSPREDVDGTVVLFPAPGAAPAADLALSPRRIVVLDGGKASQCRTATVPHHAAAKFQSAVPTFVVTFVTTFAASRLGTMQKDE